MKIILSKIHKFCIEDNIKNIHLSFTGGEILTLGKEYLERLFKLCRMTLERKGRRLSLNIQTNLTLMDKRFIQILKKFRVSVGTSFDVFGEQRKFKDGTPIDRVMIDKMLLMHKNNYPFYSIAVIHRHNYKKMPQIFDFYSKIFTDFHTLRVYPWSYKYSNEVSISHRNYIKYLKKMADRYLNQNNPKITVSNIDAYVKLLTRTPGTMLCAFSRNCIFNYLFVQNNGDIYPCCDLRYKEFYIGNILKDPLKVIFEAPIVKRLGKREKNIRKECSDCKYLEICSGGCPAWSYHESGAYLTRSKFDCQVNKAMFKYIGKILKNKGYKVLI